MFSDIMHEYYRGKTTVTGFDKHGNEVRANWIGPSMEGEPGVIVGNAILRPFDAASYRRIGLVNEGGLRFPRPKRAHPNYVFAMRTCFAYG